MAYKQYNEQEFNQLPWADDFYNAPAESNEFRNAVQQSTNTYGPEWTNKQLSNWQIDPTPFKDILEQKIENKEIAPSELPEGSKIQKEAEQVYDSNPHNDEVNDEAYFESFVNKMGQEEEEEEGKQENDKWTDEDAARAERLNVDPGDMYEFKGNIVDPKGTFKHKISQYQDKDDFKSKYASPFDIDDESLNIYGHSSQWIRKNKPQYFEDYLKHKGQFGTQALKAEREYRANPTDTNILSTTPSPFWPKERMDRYRNALSKEMDLVLNSQVNDDYGVNNMTELNRLSKKMAYLSKIDKERQWYAAANDLDSNYLNDGNPYGLLGKKVENAIESNPEQMAAALPEGTNAKEEAIQAIDGGRDAEVNNERLSEDFANSDELYNFITSVENQSGGIDWDKVKVYAPGEDAEGYGITKDDYDPRIEENRNYEYEEGVGNPGARMHRDGDFAGPDELPALNLQDYNKELATRGPLDLDLSDYYEEPQVEWEIEETREPYEESYEEPYEDDSHIVGYNGPLPKKGRTEVGGAAQSHPSAMGNVANLNTSFSGGNRIGTNGILPRGTLGYGVANISSNSSNNIQYDGTGRVGNVVDKINDPKASVVVGKQSESSGFTTNNGGSVESGATQTKGSLAYKAENENDLPNFTGHTAPPEQESILLDNLQEALIERIKGMVDSLSREKRKELGFSPVLYVYRGTPLDKLDGETLRDLSETLERMTK